MPKHIVKQGECLSSIAARYGFADWKTIYDDASNAQLRKKRPNPHLLFPGDELAVPEPKEHEIELQTGDALELVKTAPTRKLKLKFLDDQGKPMAGKAWLLLGKGAGDQTVAEGTTTGNGELEAEVPVQLGSADLYLEDVRFDLQLAGLNPMTEVADGGLSGAHGRLVNLGFDPGPEPGPDETEVSAELRQALAAFQREHELAPSGELNQETLKKLSEAHGC